MGDPANGYEGGGSEFSDAEVLHGEDEPPKAQRFLGDPMLEQLDPYLSVHNFVAKEADKRFFVSQRRKSGGSVRRHLRARESRLVPVVSSEVVASRTTDRDKATCGTYIAAQNLGVSGAVAGCRDCQGYKPTCRAYHPAN
jgi:hypothetical protein